MSKQQHTEDKAAMVLRLARENGGITYRNRAVQGAAIAFGPVALAKFVDALEAEATRDLLAALKLCLNAVELAGWEGDLSAVKARAAIKRAEGD